MVQVQSVRLLVPVRLASPQRRVTGGPPKKNKERAQASRSLECSQWDRGES